VFIFDLLLLLSCPIFNPQFSYPIIVTNLLGFQVQTSVLAIVFTRYRLHIEGIRRRAVEESEARFRIAIDATTDGFIVLQALRRDGKRGPITDFSVVNINAVGAQLAQTHDTGASANVHIQPGFHLSEAANALFLGSTSADYARVVEDGKPLISEYAQSHDPEQPQRWFFREVVKVGDGVAITLRDISASKRADAQNVELGVQREKVQILSSFIQDVSHDFRTPLAVLQNAGYLLKGYGERAEELLRQLMPPPQEAQSLLVKMGEQGKAMSRSVSHLQKLLDGMLEMTRLDHQPNYTFRSHDLNNITRTVISDTQPTAEQKSLKLEFLPAPLPLPVHADGIALHRAVQNLLDNAVHFTPAGGAVTVRTALEASRVVLEVSDSGIGIAEAELPKIFERFYRTDQARQLETGGIGLGLTIAATIIKAHQGELTVTSTLGQGSTFKVALPLHEQPPSTAPVPSSNVD
jgi:signal transduction histidine kinase